MTVSEIQMITKSSYRRSYFNVRLYIAAALVFIFVAISVSPLSLLAECHNYKLAPETHIKSQQELKFEVIEPVVKTFDILEGTEVGLGVAENMFKDSGEGKIVFNRINNELRFDEKEVEFGKASVVDPNTKPDAVNLDAKPEVDKLVNSYKNNNPGQKFLAVLPGGNLGFFRCVVGIINGKVYHHPGWKPTKRSYNMLVTKNNGTIKIMTIKFIDDKGKIRIYDQENRDVSNEIKFAVYGQHIVKGGEINIDAEDFEDELRHLFRFPLFQRGSRQIHHGFSDDYGELLLNDNKKTREAISGQPVELQLWPLRKLSISDAEREDVYASWGYANVTGKKDSSVLLPGEYLIDETKDTMTIKFLPGMHPHCAFGITKDGKILVAAVSGETHYKGITVSGLAQKLIDQGAQDAFLWSNGKDVAVRFSQEGIVVEAKDARTKSIEILVITQKDTTP